MTERAPCAGCGGPIVGKRADATVCSKRCRARARHLRDRARAATDPEFLEVLRARGRKTAAAWASAHPDQQRAKNARKDRATEARRWREAHPEHYRTPEYRERHRAASAKSDARPEARERRRAQQGARRARSPVRLDPLVVLEASDGACGICGGDVDPLRFHVDHVIPLARGGDHSYANAQAAHPTCNVRKGDRL